MPCRGLVALHRQREAPPEGAFRVFGCVPSCGVSTLAIDDVLDHGPNMHPPDDARVASPQPNPSMRDDMPWKGVNAEVVLPGDSDGDAPVTMTRAEFFAEYRDTPRPHGDQRRSRSASLGTTSTTRTRCRSRGAGRPAARPAGHRTSTRSGDDSGSGEPGEPPPRPRGRYTPDDLADQVDRLAARRPWMVALRQLAARLRFGRGAA